MSTKVPFSTEVLTLVLSSALAFRIATMRPAEMASGTRTPKLDHSEDVGGAAGVASAAAAAVAAAAAGGGGGVVSTVGWAGAAAATGALAGAVAAAAAVGGG